MSTKTCVYQLLILNDRKEEIIGYSSVFAGLFDKYSLSQKFRTFSSLTGGDR